MKFNKYWFKPKSSGYGATPTTLEGWLLVLIFVVYVVLLAVFFVPDSMAPYYWNLGIGLVVLIYVSKIKTEGDWKWNFRK